MRLFSMISGQGRGFWAQAGGALAIAVMIAGCGDNYRPTVTPVGTNGPPAQPISYAVVVSSTGSPSSDGVVTIIDYSGDTILTEAAIGPGPTAFTLDVPSANGYTLNSDKTISNFQISTSLQAKNVYFSSLFDDLCDREPDAAFLRLVGNRPEWGCCRSLQRIAASP